MMSASSTFSKARALTACLTGLEIAYMAFMHTWNIEVFAAIAGLIGTVTGVFVGRQTK
jgi:CHASE2 domain-containing sensor protein